MVKRPRAPAKTAEQEAIEIRQRKALDKEIEEEEDRFKLLARGKLGRASLLSGAPRTVEEAAGGGGRGGRSGPSSLLPGLPGSPVIPPGGTRVARKATSGSRR